ncbi:MAG: DUF4494 domain-containing protein [Bacteroidales bacterium]|nr:DUF4494 domain-containing protein [Bacteroidales bacterium]MBN2756973.1 DUF4494 domain-containing protein [Bacteroidales bacterium]
MSTWFECKVRYEKRMEDGREKKVTEPYLVDAVSFTDAEKRIHEMLESYISGDFFVTNIKIANYSEIHPNENGDRWYKSKVSYINLDEEKGVERKTNSYMLIQANTVKEAFDSIVDLLKDMISEYDIPAIQESPIMDVFPFFKKDEVINDKIPENYTPLSQFEEKVEEEI